MKKYTARPGQKVTIEINRKSKVRSPKSKVRSLGGFIKTRREDDYPARRLRSGITFYDLGMILSDGEYQDIDSQLIKPWTNTGGSGIPFPAPLDETDYAIRDALVLANLETAAQIKPEYTEHLSGFMQFDDEILAMSESSSIWSSKGLKVTGAQLAAETITVLFGGGTIDFFDLITLKGDGANKITDVYDYDADAVEFNLSPNAKIYLVPVYCISLLEESFPDHEGFFNFVQQLNHFWLFFPREPILAGTLPAEIDGKTLPNARVMRSTQTTFGGPFTNTEQPASEFESASVNSLVHVTDTNEGFLVAIIKQGANTFYVWKD